jgi:hypothetical protein
MTKAQKQAQDIIEDLIAGSVSKLEWTKDFVEPITESKARVKNWLSIRGVIQWYINAGLIKRTKDVRNEEWVACEV